MPCLHRCWARVILFVTTCCSSRPQVINFVPQQEAWVVERFGRFLRVLEPGLRFLIPVVDEIKYVHTLKEIVIEIPAQSAITQDNVTLHLDGVIYLRIYKPYEVREKDGRLHVCVFAVPSRCAGGVLRPIEPPVFRASLPCRTTHPSC